jgi:hypothetical protein
MMIELGEGQAGAAAAIATETDLGGLWWRYGGGSKPRTQESQIG